jgi:hypothetical protein
MKTAGGHSENFNDKHTHLEKILEKKSREQIAYDHFDLEPKFDGVIPRYYGSYVNSRNQTVIKIENLQRLFKTKASVLDLKLMSKKINNKERVSVYRKNGFRVAGLIRNDGDRAVHTEGILFREQEHDFNSFVLVSYALIKSFMTDHRGHLKRELIQEVLRQLNHIINTIGDEPVYNSSILILTDHHTVVCRMIDFGHYGKKNYGDCLMPPDGLDKMCCYFEKMLDDAHY